MSIAKKTCFVIIGYGKKMDYSTGRELDLDKTFDYIIKPAFEELGFLCFRASDISHSGVIDLPMYENILKADFVVADLSTLNANVLYELGIRHAVRKNTTIIIAESELKQPFDLSHILIDPYEHLGKAIDHGEVLRFKQYLQRKAKQLLEQPGTDSPLYTIFPDLEIPKFSQKEIEAIEENIKEDGSLSDYMTQAESAKNEKNYDKAIELLNKALDLKQDNILVLQRLALVTYKAGQPTPVQALYDALKILEQLNHDKSTDLETLGLAGAIYKRLFENTGEQGDLQKAIWFYEKGFYIGNDYYNGINFAYLSTKAATLSDSEFWAKVNFGNAMRIRDKVEQICVELLNNKSWSDRDDKEWILLTLAEVAFAKGNIQAENEYLNRAKVFAKDFAISSYNEQRERLDALIKEYAAK